MFGIGAFTFLTAIFLEYFGITYYVFYVTVKFCYLLPALPGLETYFSNFLTQFVDMIPKDHLTEPLVIPFNAAQILLFVVPVALICQAFTLYTVHRALHKIKLFDRLSLLHSGA